MDLRALTNEEEEESIPLSSQPQTAPFPVLDEATKLAPAILETEKDRFVRQQRALHHLAESRRQQVCERECVCGNALTCVSRAFLRTLQ